MEIETSENNPSKYYSVCVPSNIDQACVELISFRGAPVFIGTALAKLSFGDEVVIVRSKMSGVVNRVAVENGQIVAGGADLFELRNVNTVRDKSGHKIEPSYFKRPKPKPLDDDANQSRTYLCPSKMRTLFEFPRF